MAAGDVVIVTDIPLPGGYRLMAGTVTLDGSNPTPVTLTNYMHAVDWGSAVLQGSDAPGADPTQLSAAVSAAVLNVYAWKITAADNGALIASTENTRLVNWIALGPMVRRGVSG